MQPCDEHIGLEKQAWDDRNTFYRLYMEYFPKVKGFIHYFVKSGTVAEDLSQDIFEHLWMNRARLFGMDDLSAYLFRMAKNYSINYLCHKTGEDDYASSHILDGLDCLTEEEIYAKDIELLIQLTIGKMPEQRRKVFEMSRIKNLKNTEIAEILNISKKTVENHLNLALKQIRKVTHID